MQKYTLSQLCWIKHLGMFKGDILSNCERLGLSADFAFMLRSSESWNNKDIVSFFYDYGDKFASELDVYLADALSGYEENWPHNRR